MTLIDHQTPPARTHGWVCVSNELSYRDPVEMMAERGLSMAHTTILRLGAEVHTAV